MILSLSVKMTTLRRILYHMFFFFPVPKKRDPAFFLRFRREMAGLCGKKRAGVLYYLARKQ